MVKEDYTCNIWAEEVSSSGYGHRCHAKGVDLDGQPINKNYIEVALKCRPTWDLDGTWVLKACEPIGDESLCDGCKYNHLKPLAEYYKGY